MHERAAMRRPRPAQRYDEVQHEARPRSGGLSPESLLALQRTAGNRAATAALARGATLSRWRDFGSARGTAQYDYKIVRGQHGTAGRYHMKFHNVKSMDVFDEIHVVFEDRNPQAYFFYTDAGVLKPEKSHSGLQHPELEAVARELVDEQLATSEQVPDNVVEERRKKGEEQAAKDAAVGEKYKEEIEKQYEEHKAKEAQAREASKASADEGLHLDNFIADIGLGSGEKASIKAYLDGTGQPRAYWKAAVDWYKTTRDTGWKVTFDPVRYAKAKKPTPQSEKQDRNLPADAVVSVLTKPSGPKFVYATTEVTFPNYTVYRASKIGKPPPKV